MLDRALEIATDFVEAAGEDHPAAAELVAINNARLRQLDPSAVPVDDWRGSAVAIFSYAVNDPAQSWVPDHTAQVVAGIQRLSAALAMDWVPPPQLVDATPEDSR